MKKILLTMFVILVIVVGFSVFWKNTEKETFLVTSFEECVALGNPVMESYPRQCKSDDKTFVEDIGNELEKTELIRIDYPRPNQIIESPLIVDGQARGFWFFEASFPVDLIDKNGNIIANGIATANPPAGGDWMTEEFVPFEATLNFVVDESVADNKGVLILKKDNPSGLPENEDSLIVPVLFK